MTSPPAAAQTLVLKPGNRTGMEELTRRLELNGFDRTGTVRDVGEYAVRGGILLSYTAQQEDGLGDHQLGHAAGIGKGRIEHCDTPAGRRLEVHLVGAYAETPHSHKFFRSLKNIRCELGARADTDKVGIGDC